jgi:L-alanine-DL-glutamate epimerase-like enolase superfamily enzyme
MILIQLGYSELKRKIDTTLITCGEHEYGKAGFRMLLEKRCADVLQPDITWVGGLTEAKRIVALASAFDIPVYFIILSFIILSFYHFLFISYIFLSYLLLLCSFLLD